MTIKSLWKTLRTRGRAQAGKLAFAAPALIRLTVGLVFMSTGWGKRWAPPEAPLAD